MYGEFIGAWSANQTLPPLAIDDTGPDILNLFVNLKLTEYEGKPVFAASAGRSCYSAASGGSARSTGPTPAAPSRGRG